jgi:CheY-like chemotaxis protein
MVRIAMTKVLVIDDEDFILDVLQDSLARHGFTVKTAVGGRAGIETFEKGSFDLVITDIRMPDVDGNTVGAHIRSSERAGIPIIGMSGTPWVSENTVFDKVLSKPFKLETLADTVSGLVGEDTNLPPRTC